MEILQNVNAGGLAIQLGMLILAIIGVYQANKKAYERKQNEINTAIEKKVDVCKFDKLEDEVKDKATVKYVDQQDRSLHHRIDEVQKINREDMVYLRNSIDSIHKILIEMKK